MPATIKKTKKTENYRPTDKTVGEVQRILSESNWEQYWEEVSERVSKEVDAYAIARAKTLETASQHVFI